LVQSFFVRSIKNDSDGLPDHQSQMNRTFTGQEISADEALHRLIKGNERFLRGELHFPSTPLQTLSDLAIGQRPFATILGCSDSRVPPELLFGAGLGDLFVIRVAGNLFSPEVAGSIQYAGSHLHTPLFVVLGHERCGAVAAALETTLQGVAQLSRVQSLVELVLPALAGLHIDADPVRRLSQAVEANVRWTVAKILETPEAQVRLTGGRMKLVGAIYELETGRVRFLDDRSS
jgi:carbonic anhydrase